MEKSLVDIQNFKSLIYNYKDLTTIIEPELQKIITNIQLLQINDYKVITQLYEFIREVRTYYSRNISYSIILQLYTINQMWATQAILEMTYYASWKDIKYFCQFCLQKTGLYTHPLILFSVSILEQQLKMDWQSYNNGNKVSLSYAAKWAPREKTKYNWIFTILSTSYYGYINISTPEKSKTKALNKSKMNMRKVVSTLNKQLNTVEITMCSSQWDKIYLENTPIHAVLKYYKSFCRHNVTIYKYPKLNLFRKIDYSLIYKKGIALENLNDPYKNKYKIYFNKMVQTFFTTYSSSLCVIDCTKINQTLVKSSIGFTAIHADCVFIIEESGKFNFQSFKEKELTITEKIVILDKLINTVMFPLSIDTTCSNNEDLLRKSLLFIDACYDDSKITKTDIDSLFFFLFTAKTKKEMEVTLNGIKLPYIVNNSRNEFP
jgi:hypothetical protein